MPVKSHPKLTKLQSFQNCILHVLSRELLEWSPKNLAALIVLHPVAVPGADGPPPRSDGARPPRPGLLVAVLERRAGRLCPGLSVLLREEGRRPRTAQ